MKNNTLKIADYSVLISTLNKRNDEQFDNSVKRIVHNIAYLIHLDEQARKLCSYAYSNPTLVIYKDDILRKRVKVSVNLAKQLRWLNSQCKVTTGETFINTFIPMDNTDEIVNIALSIYAITAA